MSASAIHSAVKAAQKPQSSKSTSPNTWKQPANRTENVVFIDSLAYIEPEELTSFLVPLIGPNSSLIATYHTDIPSNPLKQKGSFYPSTVTLLSYFATAVLQVVPLPKEDVHEEEDRAAQVEQFVLPTKSCNKPVFQVHLSHRRKSGRSIDATYIVDYNMHEIRYVVPKKENEDTGIYGAEDQALLKGLTTFNLTTTDKQKAEREKVDLPFLQAQEVGQGGAQGGAIIYEFEKDDDYDEEDPYEDPF